MYTSWHMLNHINIEIKTYIIYNEIKVHNNVDYTACKKLRAWRHIYIYNTCIYIYILCLYIYLCIWYFASFILRYTDSVNIEYMFFSMCSIYMWKGTLLYFIYNIYNIYMYISILIYLINVKQMYMLYANICTISFYIYIYVHILHILYGHIHIYSEV